MGDMRNNKKGDGSPPWGPSPVNILVRLWSFNKKTIWTNLDMFHVEPFADLVDGEYRKMEPPSYHLRHLTRFKKGDYLSVPSVLRWSVLARHQFSPLPCFRSFCVTEWHLLHSTSTMSDPIGDFLRRIKNKRTIFQHFPHWICMTFPVMSTSSHVSSRNLSTRAPQTVDNSLLARNEFPKELARILFATTARQAQVYGHAHFNEPVGRFLFRLFSWCLDWHLFRLLFKFH